MPKQPRAISPDQVRETIVPLLHNTEHLVTTDGTKQLVFVLECGDRDVYEARFWIRTEDDRVGPHYTLKEAIKVYNRMEITMPGQFRPNTTPVTLAHARVALETAQAALQAAFDENREALKENDRLRRKVVVLDGIRSVVRNGKDQSPAQCLDMIAMLLRGLPLTKQEWIELAYQDEAKLCLLREDGTIRYYAVRPVDADLVDQADSYTQFAARPVDEDEEEVQSFLSLVEWGLWFRTAEEAARYHLSR